MRSKYIHAEKSFRNTSELPEGWKEVCLKEIADIRLSGVDKKSHIGQKTVHLCNYTDVYNNNYITNSIDFTEATATDSEIANFALQTGDVIITKDSETPNDIGVPAVVVENLYNVLCGYHLAILRAKDNTVVSIYMAKAISHAYVRRQFARLANGITRFGLTKSAIENIRILLPPYSEQKGIGEILVLWDKAIEKTATLIESKVKLKRALMQQLLTGKLRFKEFVKIKFHKIELGEFLIPTPRPVPRPNSAYTALGIRSHGKGTFLKTIENPETVMMDTLYEIKENDLIVNITFAWEGAIAIVNKSDEGGLVSHRFPTYVFNRDIVVPEYFKYAIQTKRFVHELGLVSPGGAGRNRVMSKTDFLNIVVSVPSIAEQQKIAVVLNGIDKEIDLLKKQLECLKIQKKGLMKKLLTGEIRVKT